MLSYEKVSFEEKDNQEKDNPSLTPCWRKNAAAQRATFPDLVHFE